MPLEIPLDATPEAVRDALSPLRNDFSIALLCPGNAFAVGAIIRVAHSFLAREVFVVGDGGWYEKASMGMHKYETVVRVPDVDGLRRAVAGRPVWAIERDGARRSLYGVERFPPGVVLAFGSERFGLPQEMLDAADDVVAIPIYGVNNSLPVTVAAGIVMHEWARRRYSSGTVT
jgi:tRNA G18 (ribose-2'-O)-methylase SpoU